MKKIVICFLVVILGHIHAQVFFQGIVESSDITKNTFLCPTDVVDGSVDCRDLQKAAQGLDVSGGITIQFCNQQQYWLQQEAIQAQYLITVGRYRGESLESKLKSDGWAAMGGYCIIISTNPLLTDYVMPNLIEQNDQVKVVVQLWYNGSNLIQLWSQDVQLVPDGKGFQIQLSSSQDANLSQMLSQTTQTTWKNQFLSKLDIQPDNRNESDYAVAQGSPRTVRIKII